MIFFRGSSEIYVKSRVNHATLLESNIASENGCLEDEFPKNRVPKKMPDRFFTHYCITTVLSVELGCSSTIFNTIFALYSVNS